MKVVTDEKRIEEILSRGVEDIFIKEHLREVLLSGKQLRIKLGIDPTGPAIHLGRAITLRKLKAFQNLGHQVVLIVGDFTAKIGDPSDKLEKRPMLTDEQINNNLKKYLKQIALILDLKNTEIRYNSEWLKKMNFIELGQLLECFTVQQMTKRRNFKKRIDAGEDVFMVEFLYPALQGYDSVAVKSDVEIGGFDQLFNLKAGRTVQKRYKQKEQDIMVLSMLEGTDGRKMSSSWGNTISLLDTSDVMYGQVMAVRDDLIIKYFTLCTDISIPEIVNFKKELESGTNPRNVKMKLAYEIVKIYHGEKRAQEAETNFINKFQKKEIPDQIEEINGGKPLEVFVMNHIASSTSAARRLFDAGAVTDLTDNKKITVKDELKSGHVYKIGKHRFIKIK
ncbi:MAG: tyrosine--tRNA ligase [Patescibacteria group bacterium]